MPFPPPRDFQELAHETLRDNVRKKKKKNVLMSAPGSGKTYLGMRIANEGLKRGKRVAFICDRTVLVEQTSKVADEYGVPHGIIMADHWRYKPDEPFQICSAQTLRNRKVQPFDILIPDECFPAGTMIAAPDGDVPIQHVTPGHIVYTATGLGTVGCVSERTVHIMIIVRMSDESVIECTPDHPIFTESGWRKAGLLERGEGVFRIENMRNLWGFDDAVQTDDEVAYCGGSIQLIEVLQQILLKETEQPDARPELSSKSVQDAQNYWTQTTHTWWQRDWNDEAAGSDVGSFESRMVGGARGSDEQNTERWVSDKLQGGSSQPRNDDSDRDRRSDTQLTTHEGEGRKKRRCAPMSRVESVESIECGSGRVVYNLRVKHHPSYYANGYLVHNCHIMHRSWVDLVNTTEGFAVGLSATPFSKGLGKIFNGLVHAATMHELTQKGILAPMRVYTCVRPDMKGAPTSDGEWTPEAAAQRGMGLVGDVVTEWMSRWPERKTIAFCPNVEHCLELCRQFNEAGVLAAVYSYKTPDDERTEMISEFTKPDSEIRVIISVEAISRGFDVRDIGCVIDCRPLRKSLSTVMQMWGRGGRAFPGKLDFVLQDHSGNCVRFAEDYSEIYFNGLSELDAGEKLDKTIRKEPEVGEEARACPKCHAVPFFKRCVACGYEKLVTSTIEHEAGVMREVVMIGKNIAAASPADLWAQACTYARSHDAPDIHKRALAIYKNITNQWPPREWHAESTPDVPISKYTLGKIRSLQIAYSRGMAKYQGVKV